MSLSRRQFSRLAAGALAAPAIARHARADAYPTRPVRLLSGFAPAGGNDIIARLMGQWLTERLGQKFVIENRLGAGTKSQWTDRPSWRSKGRGDQPAPLPAEAQRRMAARNARGKVDGPPLGEGDRGTADPRPDQSIRGSGGAPRTD